MSDYPPEVQAVLDAAVAWGEFHASSHDRFMGVNGFLVNAVAAYRKATAPPEPFEGYVSVWPHLDTPVSPNATVYRSLDIFENSKAPEVWRCTVTPIERVR